MQRHICLHHATTKYSSNSFVFKTKIEKEGLPRGSILVSQDASCLLKMKLIFLDRGYGTALLNNDPQGGPYSREYKVQEKVCYSLRKVSSVKTMIGVL